MGTSTHTSSQLCVTRSVCKVMQLEQQCGPSPAEPLSSRLQLVWNSSADKDTKARACAEMLAHLADMACSLGANDVRASGLCCPWLNSSDSDWQK